MTVLNRWENKILKYPSLELSLTHGGLFASKFGGVTFVPNAFSSLAEPPKKRYVAIDYGPQGYLAIPLYYGILKLELITEDGLQYGVYEPESQVKLLNQGTDHEGKACYAPLVVGTVQYMRLQRTGTDIEYRYFLPNFAGTLGTDWHIYDDGVVIDDHWTISGDTIVRSIDVVGEATASGTGDMTTLAEFVEWACGEDRLDVEFLNHHEIAETIDIDHVFYEQSDIYYALGEVAYYCGHAVYLSKDYYTGVQNVNLVCLDESNGESTYTNFGTFPPEYEREYIKSYTANWKLYSPEETDAEPLVLAGDSPEIGEERTLSNVYNWQRDKVTDRLAWILAYEQLTKISLRMPLTRMPACGERVFITDLTKHGRIITGNFPITGINLDPSSDMLTIIGRASLTYENT